MTTKPTTTYTWDTSQTYTTQPSSDLRLNGYSLNSIPAANHFNYQINSIGQWLAWAETTIDQSVNSEKAIHSVIGNFANATSNGATGTITGIASNGSGTVAAVTTTGRVLYSTNYGLTWSVQTVNGSEVYNDITYRSSGTLWTLVGDGGVIRTATDPGSTWTSRTSGVATALYGVHDDGTTCVAVGASNVILTASDPTSTWTSRTSALAGGTQLNDITKGGTYWLIVANGGLAQTASTPTGTWTSRTTGVSVNLTAAEFGNSTYVIGGAANAGVGTILYTTDPTSSFTAPTANNSTGAIYKGALNTNSGLWLMGSASGAVMYASSSDMSQWFKTTIGSSDVRSMVYNGSKRLIIGGASNTTYHTDDIETLRDSVDSNTSSIATNTSNIATNTANIATNTSNIATNTSNIGTNTSDIATLQGYISGMRLRQLTGQVGVWTHPMYNTGSPTLAAKRVCAAFSSTATPSGVGASLSGSWVIAGAHINSISFDQTNSGAALQQVGSPGNYVGPGGATGIVWDPSNALYIMVSGGSATVGIATSPDGVSWTARALAGTNVYNDVATNGTGTSVLVGASSTIASSTNGTSWTAQTAANAATTAIAWSGTASLFAAVGGAGLIQTSPTGATWTSRTSGTGNTLRCITYSSALGLLVAGGDSSTLLTSPNGTTWTTRSIGLANVHTIAASPIGLVAMSFHSSTGSAGITVSCSIDGINWSSPANIILPYANAGTWTFGPGTKLAYGGTNSPIFVLPVNGNTSNTIMALQSAALPTS